MRWNYTCFIELCKCVNTHVRAQPKNTIPLKLHFAACFKRQNVIFFVSWDSEHLDGP